MMAVAPLVTRSFLKMMTHRIPNMDHKDKILKELQEMFDEAVETTSAEMFFLWALVARLLVTKWTPSMVT